jgi:hypothetical protein
MGPLLKLRRLTDTLCLSQLSPYPILPKSPTSSSSTLRLRLSESLSAPPQAPIRPPVATSSPALFALRPSTGRSERTSQPVSKNFPQLTT